MIISRFTKNSEQINCSRMYGLAVISRDAVCYNVNYVPVKILIRIHFKFQIRQIIGKQGRLTVKNVGSQRQNQNLPLDSSTVSSNPDSEKNPFIGRSLPR